MSKSKASKFYSESHGGGGGVMGTLSETLPDERPITALHVVENGGKCPAGYWPILKTYDEDSDADLWRQPLLFGKRSCRYLCISKSEGTTGRTVSALRVISSSEPPPAGYSSLPVTADGGARAWRKRQLCYLLAPPAPTKPEAPLTDIILCSRLKKAPVGFQYAGEINGVMVCYKVGGGSANGSPFHEPGSLILASPLRQTDGTNADGNYENVSLPNGHFTPENKRRAPPERPPKKTSALLVAELNRLNLQETKNSPSPGQKQYPKLVESPSHHDYESLSPSYLQPSRPAPPAPLRARPAAPLPPQHHTLATHCWSGVEGVPFVLNSRLGGMAGSNKIQFPVIKKKSMFQLDQEYGYSFMLERQT